jgi:AraC-like DNA-binding protein
MAFWHHYPRRPLADFVEMFWLYEGMDGSHGQRRERLLPSGTVELVIGLRGDSGNVYPRDRDHDPLNFQGPIVCGPHSEYFAIDSVETVHVIGIHFKPGGAFPFLGLPAGELQNRHVSLDDLWGPYANEVHARVAEAPTAEAKLSALERGLLGRLSLPLERHRAVAFALSEFTRPSMREVGVVTEQIGMSARRFADRFRDEVGLTPKLYCRVRRFQDALRRVHRRNHVDWADVALSCGYFDQAHFNHDFRAFSGLSPSAYLASATPHLNHVPLGE